MKRGAPLLLILLSACQPSGDDLVIPDYTPRVLIDTAYLSGTIAPQISVQPFPHPILAQSIARLVDVATWPELEPVATEAPAFAELGGDNAIVVSFPLVDKKTDRWYVLRLGELPSGAKLGSNQHLVTLPDGRVGGLFRSGSWPAPLQIGACGDHDLQIYTSELVTTQVTDLGSLLTVQNGDGAPLSCSILMGEFGMVASCPGLDIQATTRITIHDGFVGATGVPLKFSPFADGSLTWSLRFADVSTVRYGCRFEWLVDAPKL